MALNYAPDKISEEDYLQGERLADCKHEYIDGEVYAMAGASEYHNLLSTNILTELKNQLKGKPCKVFMADMKVKAEQCFFYPDVMVVCQADNENAYYKLSPVIIVEVLSKATRRFDQMIKRLRYQSIPSLEEYVLIEQDKGEIQVFSRKEAWQPCYYYLGDDITFHSINVTVRVEDIYYQVDNEDVLVYLQSLGGQIHSALSG
jgi:Uma2 family endonuclease